MKIKQIIPTLISDHVEVIVEAFKAQGLTQKHHLVDENKIDLYAMETEEGSKMILMSLPPVANGKTMGGNTVIVDDLDEAAAYFSKIGFQAVTGVLAAAHTKVQIIIWAGSGDTICLMQHVKG